MTPRHRLLVAQVVAARVRQLDQSRRLAEMQLGRAHPTVGRIAHDLEELRQAGAALLARDEAA